MYLFYSIPLILFGASIIIAPQYYWAKHGIYMDFSGVEYLLGPFSIIAGIYFFWAGKASIKKEKQMLKDLTNMICPDCKQAYPLNKKKILEKCPRCQVNLLTLDEFLKTIK